MIVEKLITAILFEFKTQILECVLLSLLSVLELREDRPKHNVASDYYLGTLKPSL